MTSLLDIAPLCETVQVNGSAVDVYGISAKGIAYIMLRFPQARELLERARIGDTEDMTLSADTIIQSLPEAISVIIACGCGHINEPAAEQMAERLPLDVQMDFLTKIIRLTMPGGIGPFVQKFELLTAGIR